LTVALDTNATGGAKRLPLRGGIGGLAAGGGGGIGAGFRDTEAEVGYIVWSIHSGPLLAFSMHTAVAPAPE
jgi:hypothetical protein